jgi:hypothetical protein
MENLRGGKYEKKFSPKSSPLRDVYAFLGAATPLELSQKYAEIDQRLMSEHAWDYGDSELATNKVRLALESVDIKGLTDDEKEWRNDVLWFWYHHAISCAIGRYKDKEAAQRYAEKALEYQSADHPNKITKLLYYLVHDNPEEAESWLIGIHDDVERETGTYLIQAYREGKFYSDQF